MTPASNNRVVPQPDMDAALGFPESHVQNHRSGRVAIQPGSANLLLATEPIRRKRGKSLSRRIGQNGSVFQRSFTKLWDPEAQAYGRYWVDVPGCEDRKRRTVVLGFCSSRTTAKRKLREHIEREGINRSTAFASTTAPAMTFQRKLQSGLKACQRDAVGRLNPQPLAGWQHSLNKWVSANVRRAIAG